MLAFGSDNVCAFDSYKIRAMEGAAMADLASGALMQRASAGLAAVLIRELVERRGKVYGARVLIMVGSGNNGGDALFAGQRLVRRGAAVTAVRCIGSAHPAGMSALLAAGGKVVDLVDLDLGPSAGQAADWVWELNVDLVVDGILGIGGRPGLPERVSQLAELLRIRRLPIIAVDVPSGVACDTGAVPGPAIRAIRTVTFGAQKPCHLVEPARSHCGRIEVVDIGLRADQTEPTQTEPTQTEPTQTEPTLCSADWQSVALHWPYPDEHSDKYSRGVVGIDTGSEQYPGAGILSTHGAVYAGAGMVRFLGPEAAAAVIRANLPNVVFAPGRVQAYLFGSGWGERPDGQRVISEALENGIPAVMDADSLRYLPDHVPDACLLTPHAGELARLLGCERFEVATDPISAVKAGADQTGATVLLKGATQLVAVPHREVVQVAVPGPSWTAQAGSGDVLAGICATLLAAGVGADRAALLGASLQAMAAAAAPGPLPPQELARHCARLLGRLEQEFRSVILP